MKQPVQDRVPDPILVRPSRGWKSLDFLELWHARELLYFLAWRDVKVRYKQTVLGAAWALLQPCMMTVVLTLVLGRMAKVPAGNVPYPLFVYTGVLPWIFFANAVSTAGTSIIGAERVITKVYFPRIAIPFASVGAALVDSALASIVLVGMLTCMIQLLLFATPSIYMKVGAGNEEDPRSLGLLDFHPLNGAISFFRAAALGQEIQWLPVVISSVLIVLMLLASTLYFRRVEDSFADIV